MNLALVRYVKSFSEGRVRIRHPALHSAETAALVREKLQKTAGILEAEVNTVSGSVLILYDSAILSKDDLITMGTAWANYLDAVKAHKKALPPDFS